MIRPNFWHSDIAHDQNVQTLDNAWEAANVALHAVHRQAGTPYDTGNLINELAILTPNHDCAMRVIESMVGQNGTYFNNSLDFVETQPFGTEYRVKYHFVQLFGSAYRVEIMHLIGGHSPLHTVLAAATGEHTFPIVHASWKPPAGEATEDYFDECKRLRVGGYNEVQACESSYGQFGYWRPRGVQEHNIYLKPRVNSRDARERAMVVQP